MPEGTEASGSVEPSGAEQVAAEVEEALKNDPHRQMAERVKKDLEEAGITDESVQSADDKKKEETDSYAEKRAKIAETLKKRAEASQEKTTLSEAKKLQEEVQRTRAQLEDGFKALNQSRQQIGAWVNQLRSDPAAALKAAGIDPEQFIMGIAKNGALETPEQRQMREIKDKLEAQEKWKQEQETNRKKLEEEYQTKQLQQWKSQVHNQFLSMATSDKYSNVKKALEIGLVNQKSIIFEGDNVADTYREATDGAEAELEDILDYLDQQYGAAISKLSGAQVASLSGKDRKPVQESVASTVSKTLSNDTSGERRALDRSQSYDSEEERKERARQAVKAVLSKSHKAN